MSRWFADLSIRSKLVVLLATSTTLALLLAAVALGTFEVITFRRAVAQKIITVADIVGQNCTAALAFGDRGAPGFRRAGRAAQHGGHRLLLLDHAPGPEEEPGHDQRQHADEDHEPERAGVDGEGPDEHQDHADDGQGLLLEAAGGHFGRACGLSVTHDRSR